MLTTVIEAAAVVVGWFTVALAGSLLVGGTVRLRDARRSAPRTTVVVVRR